MYKIEIIVPENYQKRSNLQYFLYSIRFCGNVYKTIEKSIDSKNWWSSPLKNR